MREIIFLTPVFKEMIWGGNRLKKQYNYDIPSNKTGECWAISAHAKGDCTIREGSYKGKTLSWLWENEKPLFGNSVGDRFPLLTKIIDATDDLSVQVHPDDAYAKVHENGELGKTECWYILDCDEGADLVMGHYAKSSEEMRELIEKGDWEKLIRIIPIKPGDFFHLPPGTVHAIRKGTMILETQQSSDITYRLYDYNRLQDGKPRELHVEKSIAVTTCPHEEYKLNRSTKYLENGMIEHLVSCEYYTVDKVTTKGKERFTQDYPFLIVSVIEGEGTIDNHKIKKGDHFILPFGYGEYVLNGELQLITAHI